MFHKIPMIVYQGIIIYNNQADSVRYVYLLGFDLIILDMKCIVRCLPILPHLAPPNADSSLKSPQWSIVSHTRLLSTHLLLSHLNAFPQLPYFSNSETDRNNVSNDEKDRELEYMLIWID